MQLQTILSDHLRWVRGNGGQRADLREANLCGADLRDADLHEANLRGADLCVADLRAADLCGADLCAADLRAADLRAANLREAYLRDANLRQADLCEADLREANLCGADLRDANLHGGHLNWQSHDLIAEILRREAGDNIQRRSVAGLVLLSRDWCWKDFLAKEHPERDWAIRVLANWETEKSPVPKELREAMEALGPEEKA